MPNHADNAADSTQIIQAGAAPIDQRRGTRRDTSSTRQTTEVEFRQWTPAGGRRISRLTLRPMPSSPLRFFSTGCTGWIALIADNGICGAEQRSAGAYTSPPLIRESYQPALCRGERLGSDDRHRPVIRGDTVLVHGSRGVSIFALHSPGCWAGG